MLGATLWLTRALDPEEFGQFRVASNFAILLVPLFALGGERLISRLLQRHSGDSLPARRVLATVFFITGTGTVLLAVSYPLLSRLVFDGNIPIGVYYVSIAIIPLTIAYNLANTIWRHIGDSAKAQIDLNFTQRLVRAPLLIVAVLLWPGALAASLAMTAAQAISLARIYRNLKLFSLHGIGSLPKAIRSNLKELLLIGVPVALMAAVDRLDVLLVNAVMGVEVAGSYDLIYMLALTAMFPAIALSKTAEPFLYKLAEDPIKIHRLKSLQTRAFLLSFTAVFGIAIATPILARFLGNAGPDFVRATLALSAGLAFSSVNGPIIEYLQINGKRKFTFSVVAFFIICFLFAKYFFASTGSLIGVATASGLFYFTLRFALALYVRISDRLSMIHPIITLLSFISYASVLAYVWGA